MSNKTIVNTELLSDVQQLIETVRTQVARYANSASVMLYWQIGHRINQVTSERKMEDAILNDLQIFIQDMGSDFCFIARQKRMSTEKNDRFLDLLFFHRGMRRLIAIELKFSAFQPEHAGQMEWYLKWLDKNEKRSGEEKPLGIIICSDKDQEDVELMELGKNGIHIAQYLTELPPKEILEKRLKKVIEIAREKYERLKLLSKDED